MLMQIEKAAASRQLHKIIRMYCYPPRIAPLIVGNIIVNVVYIEYIVVVVVVAGLSCNK